MVVSPRLRMRIGSAAALTRPPAGQAGRSYVFRVTLFQEHFFMIKAGAVTMIPGRRGERDVFGG
jgi:hypothetical protein